MPAVLSFVLTCVTWLVERERSRETFALLRALPVPDLHIVGSKYLAYVLMQLLGLAFVLVTTPVGKYPSPIQVVNDVHGDYLFASLCLAVQLSFSHRKAAVAPVICCWSCAARAARLGSRTHIVLELVRPLARAMAPRCLLWAICLAVVAWRAPRHLPAVRSQDTQDLIG